jgi:hypothetical protein
MTNDKNIAFRVIDWSFIPKEEHKGENGSSFWQTLQLDGLRIRMVEYSPGYLADHWCSKGHIVHCIEGKVYSQLQDEEIHILEKGMSYVVSDSMSAHKSKTDTGCKLLIIDGDFLKMKE